MSEMGFENVFYLENFECTGDEVLVESSPPASPALMAARLAAPAQSAASAPSPGGTVRELIVIPELPNSINLQQTLHQVSSTVVEVNGDSSGHSSPGNERQHTYITVAMKGTWDRLQRVSTTVKDEKADTYVEHESEGSNGVNYHVQYVDSQELYTPQSHTTQMETLRTYPAYSVEIDSAWADAGPGAGTEAGTGAEGGRATTADEQYADSPPADPPQRMPPATVRWLLDNYETADGVSLPRSTLYAHYLRHCVAHRQDPVNAASFGKLIRSVFIGLRTRRLGTRGNSKYHYYGIRAKSNAVDSPLELDNDDDKNDDLGSEQESRRSEAEGALPTSATAAGPEAAHRQYLGAVGAPEPPPLVLRDDADLPQEALDAFRMHYKEHGVSFLEAVASLDTGGVERARRAFWRRPPAALCRRVLARLLAHPEVVAWLARADLALHQQAVELLLPDVLRPIPAHLTQAIRNFAKTLESALSSGASAPTVGSAGAQSSAAAALSAALRRYTSLNHLAQAARAVLTNHHQIHQMVSDLNRVDFRVVREQAAWACACGDGTAADRLEADFKATLGRGASLEQWAGWLERCVSNALQKHENKSDYSARARRLLLHWSFYSSLVIRELTLRSAASFGSFHLIRLLYDEYVAYLVERRVALHEGVPPIAVMHPTVIHTEKNMDEEEPDEQSIPCPSSQHADCDDDDPDWEWGDEDDDDEDEMICKKPKIQAD